MDDTALVELRGVGKSYGSTLVLDTIDLDIHAGESLAITGPSGCGKSTLLNLIGTLDRPTDGTIKLDGRNLDRLDERDLADLRNHTIGFVFQDHHLLPQCTALENALIPALARTNRVGPAALDRAKTLFDEVGLGDRLHHRPYELSGGQRQRVAVVRALINRPKLLLADEPTGSLDEAAAAQTIELLLNMNHKHELTLMVVTHDASIASRVGKRLRLHADGLEPEA